MRWSPGSCKWWARSASRLWKLCTSRPSSACIWGTRRCDMAATATQVVLDSPAAEFRLPATNGKTYSLDDVAGEKGTVVVFICNHCPYVKAVIDRMVSDARVLMSEGVGFAAICSNDAASYPEDSFENMKRFAKAHVSRPARRRPHNSASRGRAPRACRGHACDCDHRRGAGSPRGDYWLLDQMERRIKPSRCAPCP